MTTVPVSASSSNSSGEQQPNEKAHDPQLQPEIVDVHPGLRIDL
jgi:hypothetical protein